MSLEITIQGSMNTFFNVGKLQELTALSSIHKVLSVFIQVLNSIKGWKRQNTQETQTRSVVASRTRHTITNYFFLHNLQNSFTNCGMKSWMWPTGVLTCAVFIPEYMHILYILSLRFMWHMHYRPNLSVVVYWNQNGVLSLCTLHKQVCTLKNIYIYIK